MSNSHDIETAPDNSDHKGLLATLGLAGAFLVSACRIVPLVLVTLGISGAWIGNLTALEPYKPLTSGVAIVFIGLGNWQVYFLTKPLCVQGSYCARSQSARLTKIVLWVSTALVVLSLTLSWWAPLFY